MKPAVKKAICDYYGLNNINELFESQEATNDLYDGVQPGWCRVCGTEWPHGGLEPDAKDAECPECKTPTVDSLAMLLGVI